MVKLNNPRWSFKSPGPASEALKVELYQHLLRVVAQVQDRPSAWTLLEMLKEPFSISAGRLHGRSSTISFAREDLEREMGHSAANAPLFIKTFVDACERLQATHGDLYWPDMELINEILHEHEPGYVIADKTIRARGAGAVVPEPVAPPSLDERARELIYKTIADARRMLSTPGEERRAVAEMLWLLETFTTAFNGEEPGEELGKFFNKIIDALRLQQKDTPFDQIMGWMKNLHGYLSAPSGGGVRHGMNILKPKEIGPAEARLYVNLIMSYLDYLMAEYDRFAGTSIAAVVP